MLALFAGLAYLKYKPVFFYGEYLLKIMLGILILTFFFLASSNKKLGNKIITFLGGISFEVYLSHGFMMKVLGNHSNLPSGMFILTTIAMTILFSWIVHSWVSRPIVSRLRAK